MCDGPHFFRGVITRPAVFLLAGRKWEPDIRYRHILLGDFFSSSSSFHPPQQSLRSYIFRVNETLFFSIVAPTIFGRIIFFSTPMNYISFFFPVKSARFSCDTIIEITTPESSSSSSSSPAAAVNIDDEEVKPKWYPGPQQVPGWGYLHNMGYPEYYRGGSSGPVDCRWTIRATHGRRVRLTFLDLSIRSKCSTTRYITHTVLPSWL